MLLRMMLLHDGKLTESVNLFVCREIPKSIVPVKKTVERKQFKTIVIVNLPNELLDKELLIQHFCQYGEIVKSSVSLKNKHAIISFAQPVRDPLNFRLCLLELEFYMCD